MAAKAAIYDKLQQARFAEMPGMKTLNLFITCLLFVVVDGRLRGHDDNWVYRPEFLIGRGHIFAVLATRALSSAARIFGGDIGSSAKRTPVAMLTAFEIAANGGMMQVSPTPRTP